MCGVGNDDLGAARLLALSEVAANEKEAGVLAVGTRRWLQRHGVHAEDLLEVSLGLPHDREATLRRFDGLERVDVGEAG